METGKELMKQRALVDPPARADPDPADSRQWESQLGCLEHCLEKLPVESRKLIVDYYRFETHEKVKHRQTLAEQLGIPLNALRIRAHRIRVDLENCAKGMSGGHDRLTWIDVSKQ
jgi:DNA-directed RNA polymerase specialized sigma24 family protein